MVTLWSIKAFKMKDSNGNDHALQKNDISHTKSIECTAWNCSSRPFTIKKGP
jgi:hypothetical protein